MAGQISADHPLRRIFSSLIEKTFYGSLGIYQPGLSEYLTNVLTDFVHIDNVYRIKNFRGKPLEEVAEMLVEGDVRLQATSFSREREVHKHIGDFTLFWTGVYPEALRYLRSPLKKDHLIDYVDQGKKSYHIASTFDSGDYKKEAPILRTLSDGFELCAYGLNMVRNEWERMGDPRSTEVKRFLLD